MNDDSSGKKRRIFFALPVEMKETDSYNPVLKILSKNSDNIKNVKISNYHITLKFIGSVNELLCANIANEFSGISIPWGTIPYVVKGLGAFPSTRKPSILWLGIHAEEEKILLIQNIVEKLAVKFGFEKEKRKFKPHITIGRIRKGKKASEELVSFIENNRDTEFTESSFTKVVLYESILQPDGPKYNELITIKL